MKALNAENPRGLTRCARTDRGVHALHNVLTIQLPPLLHGTNSRKQTEWLAKINAALPASVSLLRRVTVAPDFDARRLCDRRRDEYLFPYTALTTDPSEAALSVRRRLKRLLKQFVGAHDFARFTKSGEAFLAANDTWRVCFQSTRSIQLVAPALERRAKKLRTLASCASRFLAAPFCSCRFAKCAAQSLA